MDNATTTTTSNTNGIAGHAAAHGLGHVRPWLVVLGVVIVGLMYYVGLNSVDPVDDIRLNADPFRLRRAPEPPTLEA